MKTSERIEYAEKRIKELKLLIEYWKKESTSESKQ